MLKNERKPKQFWWDEETERLFAEMVARYDPDLSLNKAILKLVRKAIAEDYLPGYEKKAKSASKITTGDANPTAGIFTKDKA